jgi:hypothetical protein
MNNGTNIPITKCILEPNFLTTLVINTINVFPSINTRDQDCKINKQDFRLHIAFLNHCLHTADRKIKVTFRNN